MAKGRAIGKKKVLPWGFKPLLLEGYHQLSN